MAITSHERTLQARKNQMHTENILALLAATRCEHCGGPAVPGVTLCLACALGGRADAVGIVCGAESLSAPAESIAIKRGEDELLGGPVL